MTKIYIIKTVYTKEELAETLKKGETALVKGSLASEIRKKYERRKKVRKSTAITGGAIAVAGLVAAPFTGGTSLVGSAVALGAMGLTIGTITISIGELALLLGAALVAYGIYKNCKVTFNKDGSITVEPCK